MADEVREVHTTHERTHSVDVDNDLSHRDDLAHHDDNVVHHDDESVVDRERQAVIEDEQADVSLSRAQQVVYLIMGIITGLLSLRLILALFGANPLNAFANFIYTVTNPLVAPFRGLFGYQLELGVARFEIETVVAMIVYALIGYLIVKMLEVGRSNPVHYSS